MTATIDIGSLITRSPDIRGGRPRIAGTGVTVTRIVCWHRVGLSPEEIADRIGHLTVGQVYAALAYYHLNRGEIDTDIAEQDTLAAELERAHAGVPRQLG
jgi:uncharacterized protein (DUF433 family)